MSGVKVAEARDILRAVAHHLEHEPLRQNWPRRVPVTFGLARITAAVWRVLGHGHGENRGTDHEAHQRKEFHVELDRVYP